MFASITFGYQMSYVDVVHKWFCVIAEELLSRATRNLPIFALVVDIIFIIS